MTGHEKSYVPLSLCIPTNGVKAWVEPVLESIYEQGVVDSCFEVVVTDNGDNDDFYVMMQKWCHEHENIRYRRSTEQGFLNQIACFREARGEYIKFVNHRMVLKKGALQHFLDFVTTNRSAKPICYFLNGNLSLPDESCYEDFDGFVRALSYYSSWSAGLGIWKDDFQDLPENLSYNVLFPHATILLKPYQTRRFCIDNHVLMKSLPEDHPKGRYNLFHAFAVEYPGILLDLYRQEAIKLDTLLQVKKDLLCFLASLYVDYRLLRRTCSYDLTGMEERVAVFYSRRQLWRRVFMDVVIRAIRKIRNFMTK